MAAANNYVTSIIKQPDDYFLNLFVKYLVVIPFKSQRHSAHNNIKQ